MTDIGLDREALALFELMLEAQPEDREAWLADRTAGRSGLLERVRALIAAEARGALATGGAVDGVEDEPAPERVGSYRVGERIGAGGMGSVYLAERERGDFDHVAAIKIIKPGLLSERLVDRFRRERQILARLRHPNIAQLFDGGETDEGSPYIVMEYVEGQSIVEWAESTGASRAERFDKLLQACSAVAFAHANLIVHRDITPSNVLVTPAGLVKLIDFGIARPAGSSDDTPPPSGESSLQTLSLTPGYAAPERMTGAEPTTAADIYSLGKLAARLFVGEPANAEFAAIVKRATALSPGDRYPTVEAFADDLKALRDGRPVRAFNGGAGYVFQRFIARHRRSAAAVALGLVALVGAFAATGVAFVRADRAREAEAQRFEQVRELANYLLFDLNEQLRRVPGNTMARADLAAQAQSYLDTLAQSPRASRELLLETAQGYARLAELQASPITRNLGKPDEARENIAKARALLDGTAGEPSSDAALVNARLVMLDGLIVALDVHDTDAGVAEIGQAQAMVDAIPEAQRDDAWRSLNAEIGQAQMEVLSISEKTAELSAAAIEHRSMADAWLAVSPDSSEAKFARAAADYFDGVAKTYTDDDAGAYPLLRSAYQAFSDAEAASPNDPDLLFMEGWSAAEGYAAAARMGLEIEAEPMLADGVQAAQRLVAVADSDRSAQVLNFSISEAYAQHLSNTGRHAAAIAEQRRIVAARQALLAGGGEERPSADMAWSEMILGLLARRSGDRELTCSSWRSAQARFLGVQAEGKLIPFHAAFLPGLGANVERCDAGRPLSAFGPLR